MFKSLNVFSSPSKPAIEEPEQFSATLSDAPLHSASLVEGVQLSLASKNVDELSTQVAVLGDRLQKEKVMFGEIATVFNDLRTEVLASNFKEASKKALGLRKVLQPFDLHEYEKLVREGFKAAEQVKGKTLVLLLGATGAGKSTTTHYLCGSTMKQEGHYFNPVEIRNKVLKENPDLIATSHVGGQSCTRYVAAVPVHLKNDHHLEIDAELLLMDAPGYGDLAGAEVDISNSQSIVEAVSHAKEVRLLILVSKMGLKDRIEGLVQMCNLIANMINNVEDHLQSMLFVHTKWMQGEEESFKSLLKNGLEGNKNSKTVGLEHKVTDVALPLAEFVVEQAQMVQNFVQPDDKNPGPLLRKIYGLYPIKKPKDVFQVSVGVTSKNRLEKQAQRYKEQLDQALGIGEYPLATYLVRSLEKLMKVLSYDPIFKMAEEARKQVRVLQLQCSNSFVNQLDVELRGDALEVCAEQLRARIQTSAELEALLKLTDDSTERDCKFMRSHLSNVCQEVSSDEAIASLTPEKLAIRLSKLASLSKAFAEECGTSSQRAEKSTGRILQAKDDECKRFLKEHQYDDYAEAFVSLRGYLAHLQQYATDDQKTSIQSAGSSLNESFNILVNEVAKKVAAFEGTKEQLEEITGKMRILALAKASAALTYYFNKECDFEGFHDKALQAFVDRCDAISDDIAKELENVYIGGGGGGLGGKAYEDLRKSFDLMRLLREIPVVELRTAVAFGRSIQVCTNVLMDAQAKLEDALRSLNDRNTDPDFRTLQKALEKMTKLKWMEDCQSSSFDRVMLGVKDELQYRIDQLEKEATRYPLSLRNPENIDLIARNLERVELASGLSAIPGVKDMCQAALDRMQKPVKELIHSVRGKFTMKSLDQVKQDVGRYSALKEQAELASSINAFLKKNAIASVVDYRQKLEKLKAAIPKASEDLKAKVEQERVNFDKIIAFIGRVPENVADQKRFFKNQSDYEDLITMQETTEERDKIAARVKQLEADLGHAEEKARATALALEQEFVAAECDTLNNHQKAILAESGTGASTVEQLGEVLLSSRALKDQMEHSVYVLDLEEWRVGINFAIHCQKQKIDGGTSLVEFLQDIGKRFGSDLVQQIESGLDALVKLVKQPNRTGADAPYQSDPASIVGNLSKRLSFFRRCQKKYSSAGGEFGPWMVCFPTGDDALSEYQKRLQVLLFDCDQGLEKLLRDQDYTGLRALHALVETLIWLDNLQEPSPGQNTFSAVWQKYRQELRQTWSDAEANIQKFLEEHNYPGAKGALDNLEHSSLRDSRQSTDTLQFKNAASLIVSHMRKLVRELGQDLPQLDLAKSVTISQLLTKAKYLKECHDELGEVVKFIPACPDVEKELMGLRERALQKFSDALDELEKFLKVHQISRAQGGLSHLKSEEGRNLRTWINNEALNLRFTERSKDLDVENVTKTLQKSVSTTSLKDMLYERSAKEIYQSLDEDGKDSYSRALRARFEVELEKCAASSDVNAFRDVTSILQTLPDSVANSIQVRLVALREEREKAWSILKPQFESALKSLHTSKIAELLKGHPIMEESMLSLLRDQMELHFSVLRDFLTVEAASEKQALASICFLDSLVDLDQGPLAASQVDAVEKVVSEWKKSIVQSVKMLESQLATTSPSASLVNKHLSRLTNVCNSKAPLPEKFSASVERVDSLIQATLQKILQNIDQGRKDLSKMSDATSSLTVWQPVLVYLVDLGEKDERSISFTKSFKLTAELLPKVRGISVQSLLDDISRSFNNTARQVEDFPLKNLSHVPRSVRTLNFKQLDEGLMTLNLCASLDVGRREDYEKKISKAVKKISERVDIAFKEGKEQMQKDNFLTDENLQRKINHLYVDLLSLQDGAPLMAGSINVQFHVSELAEAATEKARASAIESRSFLVKLPEFSRHVCRAKSLAESFPTLKPIIDKDIDESLRLFQAKHKQDPRQIGFLALQLNQEMGGVGGRVVSEHAVFKGYELALWAQKTKQQGGDYIKDNLKTLSWLPITGAGPSDYASGMLFGQEGYKGAFEICLSTFRRICNECMGPDAADIDSAVRQTLHLAKNWREKLKLQKGTMQWPSAFLKNDLPSLIGHVFSIWSLMKVQIYFDNVSKDEAKETAAVDSNYFPAPHAAQMVAVLRMLGVGYRNQAALVNCLIQVQTGEGKSVVLASTSSVLALLGCEVNVACYSDYLSTRDGADARPMFELLGVAANIHYGTFNQLCERIIGENGDIRLRVSALIKGEKESLKKPEKIMPKILLIDEVDVFFSSDFYGQIYEPSSRISSPAISEFIKFLWSRRQSKGIKTEALQSTAFADLKKTICPLWEKLLLETVKQLIEDLKSIEDHKKMYSVVPSANGELKIGYLEQDKYSTTTVYQYKTLWAYFAEHEADKTKITESVRDSMIGFNFSLGAFSYTELAKVRLVAEEEKVPQNAVFERILGVSGTLDTLTDHERHAIRKDFGISSYTYIPSVYGKKREFSDVDILICDSTEYFLKIAQQMEKQVKRKRPVLICFEDRATLDKFFNSEEFKKTGASSTVLLLVEELNEVEKVSVVKRAAGVGQVTLMTRVFGRGTDFKVFDPVVEKAGGVHVLSTFVSTQLSEEVQIRGRTARQGADGTFEMVLLDVSLELFGIDKNMVKALLTGGTVYKPISEKREAYFVKSCSYGKQGAEVSKEEHGRTTAFVAMLNDVLKDGTAITKHILDRNMGPPDVVQSRVLVLMDATGSMSNALENSKNSVKEFFDQTLKVLEKHGDKGSNFELQFAVYRNYGCGVSGHDSVLAHSPWTTLPAQLAAFLAQIRPAGGQGREAIEIGLCHAVKELALSPDRPITQIILIGDAPPNPVAEVQQKMQAADSYSVMQALTGSKFKDFGLPDPKSGKIVQPPGFDYTAPLKVLAENGVRIDAFYVGSWSAWGSEVPEKFAEIASRTKNAKGSGTAQPLDVSDPVKGSAALQEAITTSILVDIAKDKTTADTYVALYKQLFGGKTHQ